MPITFGDYETAQMARAARIIAAGGGRVHARAYLPTDARMVWDAGDMASEDWYDSEPSAISLLWALCELLRSYESPEWGNTAGRYGHSGGFLDDEDWAAIEAGDEDYDHPDLDPSQWFAIIAAHRVAQDGNLRAVIQMADILDMAIVFMRNPDVHAAKG